MDKRSCGTIALFSAKLKHEGWVLNGTSEISRNSWNWLVITEWKGTPAKAYDKKNNWLKAKRS